ncbi:hypothetical protein L1987_09250 [Smallanthus sonchifolius]|uniref:Uncharacterized protein n=1 Tax=Smallanthus sonchifolius TaxID=185202 RepID=A0ACB9JPA9_9ASTR|nr:hypothetical protein L1987_09250 [Smallanthus sonchifolius]
MGAVGDEHDELGDVSDYELSPHVRHALKSVLQTILRALTGAVSYIDVVHHRSLLSSTCAMSLWNYGPDVMDALVELVVALAASNGKYVDLCLDMLVSNFMPPYNFLEILKQPRGLAKKDQVIIRVHSALKGIADLVPLAPSSWNKLLGRECQMHSSRKLKWLYM